MTGCPTNCPTRSLRPLCLADAELVADRGRSGCGVFPALSCDAEGGVVVRVEHGGSVAGGSDRKLGGEGLTGTGFRY